MAGHHYDRLYHPGNAWLLTFPMHIPAHFREALAEDRPAMADIYRRCVSVADWLPEPAKDNADFDRDTEGELLFVVEKGTELVGFVAVWEPESFLHHVYVLPEWQGQGVGGLLFSGLSGWIPFPWRLKCLCANHRAHGFYVAQGWHEIERADSENGPYRLMELAAPPSSGANGFVTG